MLAPLGVFRKAHVPSCRKPGRCERVGILNEQVSRRPPVYSRIEVELHAKMNLRAFKSNEAIRAAVPVAYTEAKPAVVGKGRKQVTNWKDRRYSGTHECNLPRRPARCRPTAGGQALAIIRAAQARGRRRR